MLLSKIGTEKVEVWASDAQEWLASFPGLARCTPRMAYEGIVLLGRLTRSNPRMVTLAGGDAALAQLRKELSVAKASFLTRALEYMDADALASVLPFPAPGYGRITELEVIEAFESLDDLDLLFWYASTQDKGYAFAYQTPSMIQCHRWELEVASNVIKNDATVQAVVAAMASAEALDAVDPTGTLEFSSRKWAQNVG